MVLFTGPLYSGKHEAAKAYAASLGKPYADLRVCEDPAGLWHEASSGKDRSPEAMHRFAAELASRYDIILYTEVGSGLVPVDEHERHAREDAGRLSIRLADEADEVYRVFCGIAKKLK